MKKLLFVLLLIPVCLLAGNDHPEWLVSKSSQRRFIENKSQFDGRNGLATPILFGVEQGYYQIFFTKEGLTFRFEKKERKYIEEESETEREREKARMNAEEYAAFEKRERELKVTTDFVHMQWAGANPDVEVVGENVTEDYFSYTKANGENICYIKGYRKIVYRNLYPNIDVEYIFHPDNGVKYALTLHPGADPAQIKMIYSDVSKLSMDKEGNVRFRSLFGDLIDHAPVTFYEGSKNSIISSKFKRDGKEVYFSLGKYDKSKTIVIDPWTQAPNYPATNWDCVWECERDAAGNVYIIGGTSPMQLKKYSSAGVIAWTYNTPYDTTEWLGTFATDQAGNSYISQGSPARIVKVSTAGAVVWNNPNPGGIFGLTEFWSITFNCDQTKLIIGGTGSNFPPTPYIYNVDMNTGNMTQSVRVAGSGGIGNDQEVRAVAPCTNSTYYFMSHDTIGYVHQNLTVCGPPGSAPFHTSSGANLSYKCENWRYSNSGIAALCYYNGLVFVNRGDQLQKRDFGTAAILGTAAIPAGSLTGGFGGNYVGNSGIDIDACGNIYVGSTNAVHKFDQNLNLLASYPTTYNVYDVEVSTGGDIIACGSTGTYNTASRTGTIQSFAASACATQSFVCCDVSVCNAGPFCNPGPAVTLTANSSGGTWSGTGITNGTTGTFDPTVAGNGTFVITYTKPCGTQTMSVVVKTCAPPVVCVQSNGDLQVSGGSGSPYTWYQWQNGGTSPITNAAQCTACNPSYTWNGIFNQCMNGLFPVTTCSMAAGYQQFTTGTTATPPGNWPLQVVDGMGNTLTLNSLSGIPPCSNIATTTSQTNALCNGQCSGTASVTATSGTAPFTYVWNTTPQQSAQQATGLCAGVYTVTVIDGSSASTTAVVTITQPAALTVSVSSSTASCTGANASATVTPTGGTAGYTYSWSNGQTTSIATGLAAGSYTATITDANGCTGIGVANISNTGVPQASVTPTNILCNGSNTGIATVTVTVGTAPFTYSWSPGGQTTSSVTGLSAGNYQVTVTDAGGCVVFVSTTITQPSALTASANANNILCFGGTGSASVSQGGGTSPYSYSWNPGGQTGSVITGLNAGTYSVTVTDGNGCTAVSSATLTQPAAITSSTSVTGTTCGASTGSASVSANGGTGTLLYNWTPGGQTVPSISNLAAGTYSCIITDANGCTQLATAVVSNLNGPSASITGQSNNVCSGGAIGTATATATGGTGPYTYSWNTTPAQTGATVTGLAAGSYVVVVTDATGCTNTQTVSITQPAALTVSTTATQASCGQSDGTAAASAAGGSGSFTYLWSTTETSQAISGLAAGTYSVVISDANGCTQTSSVVITNSNGPTAAAGPTSIITSGSSVQLTATGGVTYVWSPVEGLDNPNISNPLATPTVTTVYCVTVTDSNGCSDSACVLVTVAEPCTNTWYLPNAFSPNDDGENDLLHVYFQDASCITEFRLQLFDRWGETVWDALAPQNEWAGTYKDKRMNSQVLTYYLHILFMDGTEVDKRGNITLVR